MKKLIAILSVSAILSSAGLRAQSSANTLDIVSWNVEFFGAPYASGPADKDLQEANVKSLLAWMNADLYGLLEVVDTMRLRRVVDFLGNTEYGFVIAPYCSGNTTGTGNGWLSGQKQAFIYRKSVFTNVTTRGIMRNSASGYTNWAAGRFPFMLTATATVNGVSKNISFILIHGKSGDTQDDYIKRTGAAIELKDTLDAYFSTANTYIIGDFNDALNTTIYTGATLSSYYPIVQDSTDADHYKSITLPLGAAGQSSMINFPNVIDNHIISNEMEPFYIPGSARIKTDVTSIVPDYVTAHNTSDHYPVFSNYNLSGVVTGIQNVHPNILGIKVTPNPFTQSLAITATKSLTRVQLQLFNLHGQLILQSSYNSIPAGTTLHPALPDLSAGVYILQLQTKQYRTAIKVTHL